MACYGIIVSATQIPYPAALLAFAISAVHSSVNNLPAPTNRGILHYFSKSFGDSASASALKLITSLDSLGPCCLHTIDDLARTYARLRLLRLSGPADFGSPCPWQMFSFTSSRADGVMTVPVAAVQG